MSTYEGRVESNQSIQIHVSLLLVTGTVRTVRIVRTNECIIRRNLIRNTVGVNVCGILCSKFSTHNRSRRDHKYYDSKKLDASSS